MKTMYVSEAVIIYLWVLSKPGHLQLINNSHDLWQQFYTALWCCITLEDVVLYHQILTAMFKSLDEHIL